MKHIYWLGALVIAVWLLNLKKPILTNRVHIHPASRVYVVELGNNHVTELPFEIVTAIDWDFHLGEERKMYEKSKPYQYPGYGSGSPGVKGTP